VSVRVNGVALPMIDGVEGSLERVRGVSARGASGALLRSESRTRRTWSADLGPMPPAEARAWRCLLGGMGDTWPLDGSLYSGAGVPLSGGAPDWVTGLPGRGDALDLDSAGTWACAPGPSWVVSTHVLEGATWEHWLVDSTGAAWLDGLPEDAPSWLTVSASSLTLDAGTYGSLWMLRGTPLPAAWAPGLHLHLDAQRAALMPRLTLEGDVGDAEVVAQVTGESVRAMGSGMASHLLQVALTEV